MPLVSSKYLEIAPSLNPPPQPIANEVLCDGSIHPWSHWDLYRRDDYFLPAAARQLHYNHISCHRTRSRRSLFSIRTLQTLENTTGRPCTASTEHLLRLSNWYTPNRGYTRPFKRYIHNIIMPSIVYAGVKYIQTRHAIQCKKCLETIESKYTSDFKYCPCGAVGIDGGTSDGNRILGNLCDMEDRSIYCATVGNKKIWLPPFVIEEHFRPVVISK